MQARTLDLGTVSSVCRFCRFLRVRTHGNPLNNRQTRQLHASQVCRNIDNYEEHDGGYSLPWVQYVRPFAAAEPFWNRLAGLFLLRRVANMLGHSFSTSDFLVGAKEAIYVIADVMTDQERHDQLDYLMDPALCSMVRNSLKLLPENAHIHLDIESVRNLQLGTVNTIVGAADSGDEHIIVWLGQKVITSQSKLQSLMDQDAKFTFQSAREIGLEASYSRLQFQLGVHFSTKEKFAVLDEAGRVVKGSNQFKDCFHFWKLGSLVSWDSDEYPFKWTVLDINNYMQPALDV